MPLSGVDGVWGGVDSVGSEGTGGVEVSPELSDGGASCEVLPELEVSPEVTEEVSDGFVEVDEDEVDGFEELLLVLELADEDSSFEELLLE